MVLFNFIKSFGLYMALPFIYAIYSIWAGYELVTHLAFAQSVDIKRLSVLFLVGTGYIILAFLSSQYDLMHLNGDNRGRAESLHLVKKATFFSGIAILILTYLLNVFSTWMHLISMNEMLTLLLIVIFLSMSISMQLIYEVSVMQPKKILGMK